MLSLTDDYFRLDEDAENIDLNEEYNTALLEINHYANLIEEAVLLEKHINFLYYLQEAEQTPAPQQATTSNNTGGAPNPSSNAKVPQPKQSIGGKIKDFFKKIWETIVLFFQKFRKNVEGYLINKQIRNLEAKLAQFPSEDKEITFNVYHSPKNANDELTKMFKLLPFQILGETFINSNVNNSQPPKYIADGIKGLNLQSLNNALSNIEFPGTIDLNDSGSIKKATEAFNKLKEGLKNKDVENEIEKRVLNGNENNGDSVIKSNNFKTETGELLKNIKGKLGDILSLNKNIENTAKGKMTNYYSNGNITNNDEYIKFIQANFSLYSWLITDLIKLIKKVLDMMMKEAIIFVSGNNEETKPSQEPAKTTENK